MSRRRGSVRVVSFCVFGALLGCATAVDTLEPLDENAGDAGSGAASSAGGPGSGGAKSSAGSHTGGAGGALTTSAFGGTASRHANNIGKGTAGYPIAQDVYACLCK